MCVCTTHDQNRAIAYLEFGTLTVVTNGEGAIHCYGKRDEKSLRARARACLLQTPNTARVKQTLLLSAATSHSELLSSLLACKNQDRTPYLSTAIHTPAAKSPITPSDILRFDSSSQSWYRHQWPMTRCRRWHLISFRQATPKPRDSVIRAAVAQQ